MSDYVSMCLFISVFLCLCLCLLLCLYLYLYISVVGGRGRRSAPRPHRVAGDQPAHRQHCLGGAGLPGEGGEGSWTTWRAREV